MANAPKGARGKDMPAEDPVGAPLPVNESCNYGYGATSDDIARGYKRIAAQGGGDPKIGPWPYHDRDGNIYIRSIGREGI